VGEPWNSVAVRTRVGNVVTTSAQLDPGHPEKVLMVRRRFAEEREEEHLRLIAALSAACAFCQEASNRPVLARVMAQRRYVNVEAATLEAGLGGAPAASSPFASGTGCLTIFHRDDANEPCARKAGWVLANLRRAGLLPPTTTAGPELGRRVFRADLYDRALEFAESPSPTQTNETESHDTQLLPA
jgi:ABC-type nitrate/sulfonate/bicarbonate transport system substrate-binding protein